MKNIILYFRYTQLILYILSIVADSAQNDKDLRFHLVSTDTNGPLPRGTWSITAIDNNSFLGFGGVIDNLTAGTDIFFNDLWRFDYLRDNKGRWVELFPSGPIPSARAFHGFSTVKNNDGKKFSCLFGGAVFGAGFTPSVDKFYCYDIEEDKWLNKSGLMGPSARSGPLLVSKNNELWMTGGVVPDPTFVFQTLNDLWKFDINTQIWTQINPIGNYPPRHIAMGGIIKDFVGDDRLLLYGGETIEPFFNFGIANDTWEYSISENKWYFISEFNKINYACIAIKNNKKSAIMFGGDVPGPNQHNPVNTIFDYDVINAIWMERNVVLSTKPPPTKRHACTELQDQYFIAGGWNAIYINSTLNSQPFLMNVYRIHL